MLLSNVATSSRINASLQHAVLIVAIATWHASRNVQHKDNMSSDLPSPKIFKGCHGLANPKSKKSQNHWKIMKNPSAWAFGTVVAELQISSIGGRSPKTLSSWVHGFGKWYYHILPPLHLGHQISRHMVGVQHMEWYFACFGQASSETSEESEASSWIVGSASVLGPVVGMEQRLCAVSRVDWLAASKICSSTLAFTSFMSFEGVQFFQA